MTKLVEELLRKRFKTMSKKAARHLISRPVKWSYPNKAEALLRSAFKKVFDRVGVSLISYLSTRKPEYVKYTRDSFESDLDNHIERQIEIVLASLIFSTNISPADVEKLVDASLESVKTTQFADMEKYYTQLIKTVPPYTDVWWQEIRSQVKAKVVSATKQTIVDFYEAVRKYVILAAREEVPYDKIISGIQEMAEGMSNYRANFLARDIIGSYNSAMSRELQTQVMGIHTYLWGTMGDERVRGNPEGYYPKAKPSHYVMSRLICKWQDPTVYSPDGNLWVPKTMIMPMSHPGEPFQCRCGAVPYDVVRMNQLLAEVEASK